MHRACVMVTLVVLVGLAGCIGGSNPEDAEAGPTTTESWSVGDITLEGATVMEENATHKVFLWAASVGPGVLIEQVSTSTRMTLPADMSVVVDIDLTWQTESDLTLRLRAGFPGRAMLCTDIGDGPAQVHVPVVAPDARLRQCTHRLDASGAPTEFAVEVGVDHNAADTLFEALVTVRDAGPSHIGCHHEPLAVVHSSDGIVQGTHAMAIGCEFPTQSGSLEPSVAVTASGALFHYPSEQLTETGAVGVARSLDGGNVWEHVEPSVQGVSTQVGATLDPFLFLDAPTGRLFADHLRTVNCSVLSWTDDEGSSWDHSLSGCLETDHQKIAAGPPRQSSTVGYPHVVYRCAYGMTTFLVQVTFSCQRSLDGGVTMLPPGAPLQLPSVYSPGGVADTRSCSSGIGDIAVDSEGILLVGTVWCGIPTVAISMDEGLTWDLRPISEEGIARGYDQVDNDVGVAVDTAGNYYAVWSSMGRMVHLSFSVDGGQTWSPSQNITAPGLNEASVTTLTAGGSGKIAVAYYGTSTSPGGPFPYESCAGDPASCEVVGARVDARYGSTTWDGYITTSANALAEDPQWTSVRINDGAFPLLTGECDPDRCGLAFDFIDVTIGPEGAPWAAFIQTDGGGSGVVGHVRGGGSLWDEEDPNGPYPGT